VADAEGLKLGKIAQPLRVAVAGRAVSPPIDVTLTLLGREKTLARLDVALEHIRKQAVTA
jgi:glutamyl-tRNA synthetase